MKKILAITSILALGLHSHAREFSREFDYGDTTLSDLWYNIGTGWSSDGSYQLWDYNGQAPASDDNFYYKANGINLFSNSADLAGGTVHAGSMAFHCNWGASFNSDSGDVNLDIAKNLDITIDQWNLYFAFGDNNNARGFKSIRVGGDININATGIYFQTTFMNRYAYGLDDPGMVVGGAVNFTRESGKWLIPMGNDDTDPGVDYVNGWVQVGGLNGTNLILATSDRGALSFNLVFKSDGSKAFAGGTWSGAFANRKNAGAAASITMDAGESGGLQTVRLQDSLIAGEWNAMTSQTLDMVSGRLSLGTDTLTKFTRINVKGGTLYIDDIMSTFATDVLNLSGGELVFDVWSGGGEYIIVDAITGSGTAILIDLDAGAFSIGDSVDGCSYGIFQGVREADWDAIGRHVKFMLGDEEVSVNYTLTDGVLALSGEIAAVPEPAAVATVFGALALVFAAWRKRK